MFEQLFDPQDLCELVRQCLHLNVAPMFLQRYRVGDSDCPIGRPLTKLLGHATQRLSEMPESRREDLLEVLPSILRWFMDTRDEKLTDGARVELLAYYTLITAIHDPYFALSDLICGEPLQGEAFAVYPELSRFIDDEGMFPLTTPFHPRDIGLAYKDHVLHYSQFLRRGFSSNPNFDFIERFIADFAATGCSNDFRVALDHRRLMPKDLYSRAHERDMWYGPRFDRERLCDPSCVGVTVVKRASPWPGPDDYYDRTEFKWTCSGSVKTLGVEEISKPAHLHDGFVINRYIHAELNLQAESFSHFDGAVKIYTAESYDARFDTTFPNEPKCSKKIKLFRIDGNLEVERWIELTSFFFRGNEMITEYFDPDLYERLHGGRVREFHRWQFGVTDQEEPSA